MLNAEWSTHHYSSFSIPRSSFRVQHSAFSIPHSAFSVPHSASPPPHTPAPGTATYWRRRRSPGSAARDRLTPGSPGLYFRHCFPSFPPPCLHPMTSLYCKSNAGTVYAQESVNPSFITCLCLLWSMVLYSRHLNTTVWGWSCMIYIIRARASPEQMHDMLATLGVYIKLAVDVQRNILAGGGALHADCESALLDDGSSQEFVWGADWNPYSQDVTFESLINIRPRQGNRSLDVRSQDLRNSIARIVRDLLQGVSYD